MFFFRNVLFLFRSSDRKLSRAIKTITGVTPIDIKLYESALLHSSFTRGKTFYPHLDNQRLEFLGDAILGAITADYLYKKFPDNDEGFLTNFRSKIVSRKSLNSIALNLGLHKLVKKRLDKNKKAHSIYGDALEALIGAIYLDRGLKYANHFILEKVIDEHWGVDKLESHIISYKSTFIEWAQKEKLAYNINTINEWGEKHDLTFEVGITLNETEITRGQGTSKKRAEEEASRKACLQLKIL